jgi:ParB family chromosome partitioning protein
MDAFAPITPRTYEDPVYTPPAPVAPTTNYTPPAADTVFPPDTFVAPAPLPANEQPTTSPEHVSYNDAHIQEIDITRIVPNPYQPRKVFNQEALEELAASIREHGVIQPLVVTETETGYEIVVGERRFRASQLAGLDKVPAIIKKSLGDQTKLEVALIENIQRQELNPIEEAQAYDRLIKTFNLTQDQVAKKVGKARPSISNTLRLLNLPAVIQRAVVEGKISEGHARALLAIPESEKQLLMFDMIIEQGMNVRQVEAKVREITVKRQLDAVAPDPHLMAIETELRGKLGTQVKIQRQGRGGRIMIEFFSEEDLQEIIDRMADSKAAAASGTSSGDYFTV